MSSLSESHQEWLESVMSDMSEEKYSNKARHRDAVEILDYALEKLSPEDRMVVKLVYLEGYTGKEAAGLLGWSTSNVKIRSYRAKKKMKKIISGIMRE